MGAGIYGKYHGDLLSTFDNCRRSGYPNFPRRLFLFPWTREEELVPTGQVASIRRIKGVVGDALVMETTGGTNMLELKGLRKQDADRLQKRVNMCLRHGGDNQAREVQEKE